MFSPFSDYAAIEAPEEWGQWVKFVMTPLIVTIGVIGNALSFIVMKTKSLRYKSYSHYLCALAFFDTVTLVLRLVRTVDEYYRIVLNIKGLFQSFNHASCAAFNFIEHVSYLMSSWLIVLMAIERLVAVCFPFKKTIIRKQSGAITTIGIMCLLVCASQFFRVIMVGAIGQTPNLECASHNSYIKIYSLLTVYYYEVTLVFVVPVAIILTCNCLVLYQIFRVQKAIKQKEPANARYRKVVNKRHRTTYMLLIVSFTYIVTLLPSFIVQLIIDISIRSYGRGARQIFTALYPFMEFFSTISLINYGVNFFIYILSGQSFRFELRKIFVNERSMSFTGTRGTREEFIRLWLILHLGNGNVPSHMAFSTDKCPMRIRRPRECMNNPLIDKSKH